MKFDIYIGNPVYFCKGGGYLPHSLYLDSHAEKKNGASVPDEWIFLQTIEIDETLVDTGKVLEAAQAELDEAEKKTRAEYADKMAQIEAKRGELLALPGVSGEWT